MKLKLVALLFSQAASALTIDKTNYRQHLCDDRILVTTQSVSETINPHLESVYGAVINGDHQYYCTMRSYYEEAVENQKTATWRTKKPCASNPKDLIEPAKCMEKEGIFYAQACEKLKQDRDTMPNAWNAVMPKLAACNNM